MKPKLIYFAEPHPSLDEGGFRQRWRKHGRLGMSLPRWRNVERYAQCDRVDAAGLEGVEIACAGVATVLFRSEEARLSHIADPDGSITRADEAETFARPVREFCVLTQPRRVLPAEPADAGKLFVTLRRADGLAAEVFASRWAGATASAVAKRLDGARLRCGYIQNLRRPDWAELGVGFDADCVDEIATDDPAAAWRAYRSALADVAGLFADVRFVLTRQTVLSGAASAQP